MALVKDVRPYLTTIVEDNRVNFKKARDLLGVGKVMNPEDDIMRVKEDQIFTP